ncbi:hypothetical protein [Parasitella parasitica]|uniref:Major facilitator superfamily (MFS) profile domain-containing protein n=1 Tax=Parasitella parasitica TaxID=35722 RepID=A0A0B7NPM7_9FUNG|nr:hypothetical protein [Parasitella parasitica]
MPPFTGKYDLISDSGAGYAIVPVSLAASFIASFVSGFIADKLGRKKFFYVASIIHEIGCIVEIAGQSLASFFAGRIITGIAIGIYSMLVPLYQSEIAKPQNRGRLITFYQIFVTLGFCIAFWLGYGTYRIDSDVGWRIPVGLQLVAGFFMLCGLYFIPESPRWLIYKDRNAEALKILAQLRSYGNEHDVDVQMEFTSIVQDVSFDKMAYTERFMSLLRKGNDNNRKRTLLGAGIHVLTQLSGINALLFYLPHILESAGIKEAISALLGNGVGGAVNFVATLFVLFYIDRWDRRRILVYGALAMAVCMLCITIVSAIYNQQLIDQVPIYGSVNQTTSTVADTAASYAILALLCVFIAFFALSWGPIGWIYPAEIYPQMIRANAMGITTSCSYLFNLFVSLVSPVMFREILWGTYLFFGLICLIMAAIVQKYYPETRGRSLEEIQLIFSGALIDQRPDAHHPATAAEALLHLEQIQHKDKRDQMNQPHFSLNIPTEWSDVVVSNPHNVSRALNNLNNADCDYDNDNECDTSIREIRSQRTFATSSSIASWPNQSSIELDQIEMDTSASAAMPSDKHE